MPKTDSLPAGGGMGGFTDLLKVKIGKSGKPTKLGPNSFTPILTYEQNETEITSADCARILCGHRPQGVVHISGVWKKNQKAPKNRPKNARKNKANKARPNKGKGLHRKGRRKNLPR
jgi:hypothetical protein